MNYLFIKVITMSIANLWDNAKKAVTTYASKVAPAKYVAAFELNGKKEEMQTIKSDFLNSYQTALIEDRGINSQDAVTATYKLARQYDAGLARYLKGESLARTGQETVFEKGVLDALEFAYSEVKSLNDNYNSSVQTRAEEISKDRANEKAYMQREKQLEKAERVARQKISENNSEAQKRIEIEVDTLLNTIAHGRDGEYKDHVKRDLERALYMTKEAFQTYGDNRQALREVRNRDPDLFFKYGNYMSFTNTLLHVGVTARRMKTQYEGMLEQSLEDVESTTSVKPAKTKKVGVIAGAAITAGLLATLLSGCGKAPINQTPTPSSRPTVYVSHASNNDVKVSENYAKGKQADASKEWAKTTQKALDYWFGKKSKKPTQEEIAEQKRLDDLRRKYMGPIAQSQQNASNKPAEDKPTPKPSRYVKVDSASGHNYVLDCGKAAPAVTQTPENYNIFDKNAWLDKDMTRETGINTQTNIGYLSNGKFVPYAANLRGDVVPGNKEAAANKIVTSNISIPQGFSGFMQVGDKKYQVKNDHWFEMTIEGGLIERPLTTPKSKIEEPVKRKDLGNGWIETNIEDYRSGSTRYRINVKTREMVRIQ